MRMKSVCLASLSRILWTSFCRGRASPSASSVCARRPNSRCHGFAQHATRLEEEKATHRAERAVRDSFHRKEADRLGVRELELDVGVDILELVRSCGHLLGGWAVSGQIELRGRYRKARTSDLAKPVHRLTSLGVLANQVPHPGACIPTADQLLAVPPKSKGTHQ